MSGIYANQWKDRKPPVDMEFKPSEQTKEEIKIMTLQHLELLHADKYVFGANDSITQSSERDYRIFDKVCEILGISYELEVPGHYIKKDYSSRKG